MIIVKALQFDDLGFCYWVSGFWLCLRFSYRILETQFKWFNVPGLKIQTMHHIDVTLTEAHYKCIPLTFILSCLCLLVL